MNTLKTFAPFWLSSNTLSHGYKWEVKDDMVFIDFDLPGVEKKDIELKFSPDRETITIFVKGRIDQDIFLHRPIDPDNIEAELTLGVLKIRAPIKTRDRIIEIK